MTLSSGAVTELEQENARLSVALGDSYTALARLQANYDAVKHELEWFKRQLFGQKSEKRLDIDPAEQLNLLAGLGVVAPPSLEEVPKHIVTYERRAKVRDAAVTDSGLRFGPDVPVETIEVKDPSIEAIPLSEREVIGEKVSYRLAQQPGSYVVLKYVRKVVKRRDTETIVTPPAPANVLERSAADVSFLAGMLVDKFSYHLPLYRQHQRLRDGGIELSRSTLIQWTSRAIDLLAPITAAQSAQVLTSRVLAMDETSIKAGREGKGKMRTGWLWPVYGDHDEVVFHYAPTRAHRHVHTFLGEFCGTLLSDGYEAYAAYAAQRPGKVTHAQCWSHTRRGFERANDSEPEAATEALALIGAMYGHEKPIRCDGLTGEDKRAYRQTHTRPVVETFWRWCRAQCHRADLLPKSPLAKALNYALERRSGLEVFLHDPEVAIDTNHLERALRPIPMGKRNWLFASTEVGAQRVGIVQSLLVTCRLHSVDSYTYLVDVLQRVSVHPAKRVIELTPRMWKSLFADAPLRSDLGPHHHEPPPH